MSWIFYTNCGKQRLLPLNNTEESSSRGHDGEMWIGDCCRILVDVGEDDIKEQILSRCDLLPVSSVTNSPSISIKKKVSTDYTFQPKPTVEGAEDASMVLDQFSVVTYDHTARLYKNAEWEVVCSPTNSEIVINKNKKDISNNSLKCLFFAIEGAIAIAASGFGLYGIQSAASCKNNRTILVVGQSGSGKTTITMALVQQGFQFLSEQRTYLCLKKGHPVLLKGPSKPGIRFRTTELIPSLERVGRDFPSEARQVSRGSVDFETPFEFKRLFPHAQGKLQARPGIIVYPSLAHEGPVIDLSPMSKTEVVTELMQSNVWRVMDPDTSQLAFRCITMIAAEAPAWRLTMNVEKSNSLSEAIVGLTDCFLEI